MTPTQNAEMLARLHDSAAEALRVLEDANWFKEEGLDRWEREFREDVKWQLELIDAVREAEV